MRGRSGLECGSCGLFGALEFVQTEQTQTIEDLIDGEFNL